MRSSDLRDPKWAIVMASQSQLPEPKKGTIPWWVFQKGPLDAHITRAGAVLAKKPTRWKWNIIRELAGGLPQTRRGY